MAQTTGAVAPTTGILTPLSRLVYVDSGGLSLLFDTVRRFEGGGWLGIVNPSPNVRRVMEMTGLSERSGIRIIEDLAGVPAALAELPS